MKKIIYGLTLILSVATLILVVGYNQPIADASAPSGLFSSYVFSTTTVLDQYLTGTGNGQVRRTVAPVSGNCSSRIISTTDSAIMLSFFDPTNGDVASTTLAGMVGHYQAASTTVAYDSGLYGCGRVTGYAYATTTITVTETR